MSQRSVSQLRLALFLSAIAVATPARAQDTDLPAEASSEGSGQERTTPGGDDLHDDRIVVTAAGLDRLDVLAGTSVVEGIELQRELGSQLGDTLAKLPGVSASSFSPGASRPILRGLGGERVRVLSDGVGALDASSTSADHAVSVEPLVAERIEVLRGPAVLLYGSQAIGGAVNVVTKRIPPRVPDEPLHVDALIAVDSASDRIEEGISLDAPLGRSIAIHADASYRSTDDLEIPGFVASDALREDLLADAAEEEREGHLDAAGELREGAAARGVLPNSQTRTYTLGTGVAFFSGESDIGVSFDYYDTSYGIPGLPGFGHAHGADEHGADEDGPEDEGPEQEHGEESVAIGMERYRVDLRGTLDLGEGFFDSIQTRWGYSDYTHTEFEGDEVGTVFEVEGVEGRVELVQSRRGSWGGSIGGQYSTVDFAAIGEEAFVPANVTESFAIFAVQEIDLEPFQLELGGRYEHTDVDAKRSVGLSRGFDGFSGALGLSYELIDDSLDDLRFGVNLSRAERAPSAQELFADGPHVATRQFELGNAALDTESSWGVEAYVRGTLGPATLNASIYQNWFDGFIFLAGTGAQEDGLEVFRFLQSDVDQFGVEGELSLPLYEQGEFALLADLRGDYTRATLDDGSPVPRIPPLSLLGALEAQLDHWDARAELQWFDDQTRVSQYETPTEGFTFVNLSLAWHPLEGSDNITIIAQAENVFDEEGRRHASFTKDFVPLAGRNFRLSARASF